MPAPKKPNNAAAVAAAARGAKERRIQRALTQLRADNHPVFELNGDAPAGPWDLFLLDIGGRVVAPDDVDAIHIIRIARRGRGRGPATHPGKAWPSHVAYEVAEFDDDEEVAERLEQARAMLAGLNLLHAGRGQ